MIEIEMTGGIAEYRRGLEDPGELRNTVPKGLEDPREKIVKCGLYQVRWRERGEYVRSGYA